MIKVIGEHIIIICILIGTVFSLLSAVGAIRLPDVYNRTHGAAKSTTLGVMFTLIGTFFYFLVQENYFSTKLILGIFFVFLTSPVSSHMILRSAYRANVEMADISVRDDLKDYFADDASNQ